MIEIQGKMEGKGVRERKSDRHKGALREAK